jgi:outer membrane protein assembly factor BamB
MYADGSLFFNTLDGNTIALDAATGKERWKTRLGNINLGETITMAPLVVKGKVLVGNAGGDSACAAGSRRSMPAPASCCGRPTAPVRTADV